MLAVIQQPYFLPWLGYLAKAKAADVFVLLDDAPFRRNHLHRTRTLSAQGEPLWLSVPVGAHQGHALDQIHLPAVRTYIDALLKSLQLSYGRGGHFRAEFPFITDVLAPIMQSVSVSNLSQQNILLLQASCEYLDIACDFVCASTIATPAERTARTVALLANVAAEGLVLGDGASSTVHDLGTIRRTAELFMLPYSSNHPQYRQVQRDRNGLPFLQGLSFLDALLNCGRDEVRQLLSAVDMQVVTEC